MKKQVLIPLLISLFAVTAWADVSVTEKFTRVKDLGDINTTTTASGLVRTGDVCNWNFSKMRYTTDVITVGSTNYTSAWLNYASENQYGELATTNLEGGIKAVSFRWAQFGNGESGNTLKLKVAAGSVVHNPAITRDGSKGKNAADGGSVYEHTFHCKTNGQLVITNVSNKTADGACRILVCNIGITPYLLYRNKDVTVGLKQRGYANNGSQDFINNTGTEGSISYSSSATGVATVDENGVITPISVGTTTITAAWSEGASTTYTLHVVDGIIAENFSNVVQTSQTASATWHGDLWDWKVANVRRGEADTLGLNPRIQATAMRSNTGSTLISAEEIEGGVKNLAFDWRQWGSATTPLTFNAYYSADKENWGEAVATQAEDAVAASTPHTFNKDIDDGAKGNAYLKIEYTSGAGQVVIGALKITPYLLYTTKEATLDTRNSLVYTNTGLINNTTGDAPTYEIAPENAAVSINGDGQVAVEDGADVNGDFIVTATWGAVTTTYTLHIASRTTTEASYPNAAVRIGLDGAIDITLAYTAGYDGTIAYVSSNTAVATVASNGTVTLAGGVGQTTITATLPQTSNYKAASASYNLYVRDNGARKEAFGGVHIGDGVVGTTAKAWAGDLFPWTAQYSIRKNANDTIWGTTKGVWIGTGSDAGGPGVLNSTDVIEGGIKYLSFYWKQWANESGKTLRIAAFDGETRKGYMEYVPSGATTHEKFLLGINDVMRGNRKLYIKNESYTGASFDPENITTSNSRIILDTIYITPYLLYTTKERTLDLRTATSCTYTPDIDNTESGSITYSLEDNDEEATIDAESGEVTGIKAGEVTVKATWSEGAYTTYTLTILAKSVAEPSFAKSVVRVGLNEAVANALSKDNHDGTAAYTSSNTAVASVASDGAITINGVGQTTITATLPETENYFAAEASYNLYIRDKNATIKEHFKNVANGTGSIGEKDTIWTGVAFDWKPQGAIRHNGSDTIWGTATKNRSVWIATTAEAGGHGVLGSKEVIEGGIKYLSFYWQQWGAGANTLRLAAFAGDTRKEYMERPGTAPSTYEKFLFGANNFMKKNEKLYIKNESFSGESFDPSNITTANSRMIIDTIFITPWLLFTDKAERIMRIGETDQNTSLINNIGEDATFFSSDPTVASVAGDGTVTAIKRGNVIITAKYEWNESESVTTTYPVAVYPVNCETFDGISQTSNYNNSTPRVGDKATWSTSLGGFNVGDFSALTTNLARFRAPNNASEKAYIESSAIEGGIASMTFDWNLGGAEGTTEWDIRVLINGREVKKLTNTEITAAANMDHFEQITINGINEPDNFTIRFENHSKIGGTYPEGNKARFLIDNIVWTSYNGSKKTLAEDAYNDGWVIANDGETRDVIISRSALVHDVWNTLCLPFDLPKSALGEGAEVKALSSASLVGDELEIVFDNLVGDVLAAGTPYLVMPVIDNKDISGTYDGKEIHTNDYVERNSVTLQGIFSPIALKANDYSTLFVGTPVDGNNLFYPSVDGTLKGFRAYFKIADEVAPSAPLRRARFVINEQQVATELDATGQQVEPLRKQIQDGQLIIIRDGVRYDVLGRKL